MLQTIKLLLPALIPSWRFFDWIAPSPRIEFALLETMQDSPASWQEFRPRPAQLSVFSMLKRMFYNPDWNESLFLVSCAERLMQDNTQHSAQQILDRIKTELRRCSVDATTLPYVQFRLVFLNRHITEIQKHIIFVSPIYRSVEDKGL